ncbi:MAG: hypothetical protein AAGF10_07085 [Verrucomicrobiota bacterium]
MIFTKGDLRPQEPLTHAATPQQAVGITDAEAQELQAITNSYNDRIAGFSEALLSFNTEVVLDEGFYQDTSEYGTTRHDARVLALEARELKEMVDRTEQMLGQKLTEMGYGKDFIIESIANFREEADDLTDFSDFFRSAYNYAASVDQLVLLLSQTEGTWRYHEPSKGLMFQSTAKQADYDRIKNLIDTQERLLASTGRVLGVELHGMGQIEGVSYDQGKFKPIVRKMRCISRCCRRR